jgi:hypothetical protein
MTKLNKKAQKCDRFRDKTGLKKRSGISQSSTQNIEVPTLPKISEILSTDELELLHRASNLTRFVNPKADNNDR